MEKKTFLAFASMMVLLKDRQCQVPSLRASKWGKRFFFLTSMMVLLEDRQCQVPSLRASEWKKKFFVPDGFPRVLRVSTETRPVVCGCVCLCVCPSVMRESVRTMKFYVVAVIVASRKFALWVLRLFRACIHGFFLWFFNFFYPLPM